MARPNKHEQQELEQLESLAGLLSSMSDDRNLLSTRLAQAHQYISQAHRRALGYPNLLRVLNRLQAVLNPTRAEMGQIEAAVSEAQQILADILAAKQDQRTKQNNGSR